MDKKFLMFVAVALIALGGIFYFARNDKKSDTSSNSNVSVGLSNHSKGAGNKNVEVIEYGDFQCPSCGQYFPIVKQVVEKFGDDIKFTFRNFPLDQIHTKARLAHRAAEAAGIQGKFWEMHDKLYENQNSWTGLSDVKPVFEGYAKELGLDIAKYNTDLASSAVNDIINADLADGKKKDITGTPTFFIDGKKIDNLTEVNTADKFIQKVQEAIDAKAASANPTPTPTPADPNTTPTTDNAAGTVEAGSPQPSPEAAPAQ